MRLSQYFLFCIFALPAGTFAKDIVVLQKDKSFKLSSTGSVITTIDANIGDVLKFKNEDALTHNVYSITTGNEFEIKVQKPGETGVVVVDPKHHKKGKMEVECAIHPNMKLIVNIKK